MNCRICNRFCHSSRSLGVHIRKAHQISTQVYYDKYLKKPHEGICVLCGNETNYFGLTNGYRRLCSNRCTSLDPRSNEKKKQTCLVKYGVDSQNKSEEVKKKTRETWLKNYGTDSPNRVQIVKEKKKETVLKNFGVEHALQNLEVQKRWKCTNKKRYGVEFPGQRKEHRQYMLNGGAAHALSFAKNPSKPQVELFNLTKKLYPDCILNFPVLNYSVDIAIPSKKIVIEYDGSYWHQDKNKDLIRQGKIESIGWNVLRFIDYVPSIDELKDKIETK